MFCVYFRFRPRFLNQSGSWFLLKTWLTEAFESRNTPLLFEILELLQLCPMSETRLKDNDVTTIIQSIAQEFNDQSKSFNNICMLDNFPLILTEIPIK